MTKQVHQDVLLFTPKKEGKEGLDKRKMCFFVVPFTLEYLHSLNSAKYLDTQVMLVF